MLNIDAFLAPISDDQPSGPDLEYDPAFLELESAAKGKAEQQFGDTVVAAEEPDWRDIDHRATEILGRTKDLRVVAHLLRAQTRLNGVPGCVGGLRLMSALLDKFWDSLHPMLDVDDDNDPTMRVNALASLTDLDSLPKDLRDAVLGASRSLGVVAVRDAEIALGKLQPKEGIESKSLSEIDSILRAAFEESPDTLSSAVALPDLVKSLQTFLTDRVSGQAPDLAILKAIAYSVNQVVGPVVNQSGEAIDEGADGVGAERGGDGASSRRAITGDILNRGDAVRALDKVSEYLQRTEPTNPAPLLIERAKKLMTMSFMEVIAELAPDSLSHVKGITGQKDEY